MNEIEIVTREGYKSVILVREDLNDLFLLLARKSAVYIIIDKNVQELYGELFPYPQFAINATEEEKSLHTIERCTEWLLSLEAGRDAFILGVGGGITTDIAGFVASIYKRGVKFGYLPTTLLSQVDASIGGKNGVNFNSFKNILGTINQPEFTYSSIFFLKYLGITSFNSGISEMIKAFIINDKVTYQEAISFFRESACEDKILAELIAKANKIKCDIVNGDMFENGDRRLLNLGHTFAHAIEKNDHNISHGEAVAIGVVYAAEISHKLNYLDLNVKDKIISDFKSIGLPTSIHIDKKSLIDAILNDKKRSGDKINFILIKDIGEAFVAKLDIEIIESLVDEK